MDKHYYKEYYILEREHWWFRVRAKIILQLIKESFLKQNQSGLKILNIGAATGKTSELLSAFGEVTSLEYDQDCCDFANSTLGLNIINGSILELPFVDKEFDLVCAFDVIEHVEDDLLGTKEMNRVCKDNGIIVVTVPAFMSLWSHHDEVNHHFRRYTLTTLRTLFKNANLSVIKSTYFNTILFIPIFVFRSLSKLIPEKWIRTGAGSDATLSDNKSLTSKILYQIFNFELFLLRYFRLPFGVSIFFSTTKKSNQ